MTGKRILLSHGRSARRVDDRNVLITFECCGRSGTFAREDDGVLTASDINELLVGLVHECEEGAMTSAFERECAIQYERDINHPLAFCPDCTAVFLRRKTVPRHTRSVRGIGWGGKPMHLPCPGGNQ